MNRSEKRRSDRQVTKQTKVYTLTQAQIDQIKKDATDAATKRAFAIMLAMPMMVLRDKFGFGQKRLNFFLNETFAVYEAFEDDRLTMVDMHETIKMETGVIIKEAKE